MNTEALNRVRERFRSGEIKQQHLETEVFKEVYSGNADDVAKACRDAARIRCEALEETTGVSLDLIRETGVDNCTLPDGATILPGIEMKIGAAMIPMGYAGPVTIHGDYAQGSIYVPLATNEAALVAGVQRGIKAINMAGGIHVLVRDDGMHRAPALEAPDIRAAAAFCEEIRTNPDLTRELGEYARDPFVRLDHIEPWQLGRKVYLRLKCKTGDAMGMNGVTKASADICRALVKKLEGWRLVTISSNLCCDKKAAHINVLHGRGKSVDAEVFLPEEVLTRVFKKGVTSRNVEKLVYNKCYLGSALAGTLTGFNINAANVLAALFAAAGQDLAQVVESSSCFIQADAVEGGLHFTVSLPCLEVATMGGGTLFGTAREALALMGCDGRGKSIDDNGHVMRLAEIATVAVAALDLNTACAQAAGDEMADSHVRLARGEKE